MPTGKVKWYDVEKGFGFLSQDEGEDVYVRSSALPDGVEALKPGQRVEFGMAAGRRGPQALSLKLLETPPSLREERGERGGRGERGDRRGGRNDAPINRKEPEELHGLIEDMITLLETKVQPDLRRNKYPDRKMSQRIAEVVRGVARELDH
ncbi:cold-shock protein [Nocardia sp. NPDC059240]|uniref:cold-shock protein n=1 Tax=Nocardia sp. NPDC059240 TaxID=3346786 RepID=UPI0036C2FACC